MTLKIQCLDCLGAMEDGINVNSESDNPVCWYCQSSNICWDWDEAIWYLDYNHEMRYVENNKLVK